MPHFLLMVGIAVTSCSGCGPSAYERGTTDYESGKATVVQPDIKKENQRKFDGIRVAGRDTDIEVSYWNRELALRGHQRTFELFKARYKDLQVYQTKGAEPALRDFERWCKTKGIASEFREFWGLVDATDP